MNRRHPFLPDLGLPLVLASASPRRAEILRAHGIDFGVEAADVDESLAGDESPVAHAERLAREKARKIAARRLGAAVLGSDTIVLVDGELLGKPRDTSEARAMLTRLSGREHVVVSAVSLQAPGFDATTHRRSRVRFRELSAEEIAAYVEGGEPMDKAGAYGIQGEGALLVESIDGCYFNVMGLPLQGLRELWLALAGRPKG